MVHDGVGAAVKALLLQDLADGRGRQSLRISDDDDAVLLGGPSAPGGGLLGLLNGCVCDALDAVPEGQQGLLGLDEDGVQFLDKAVDGIGVPSWMEIQFKTTTTALKEAGEDEFIETETADAVRFTKPRGAKE